MQGRGGLGQQLDRVLHPDPGGAVQLPLQYALVICPRGRHHQLNVPHKLLSLHQLDTSVDLTGSNSLSHSKQSVGSGNSTEFQSTICYKQWFY